MVQFVFLLLALSIGFISQSRAEPLTGQEMLKEIHQNLSTFPNYRGKCGSLNMTYHDVTETDVDRLQVSFKSKGRSIDFSIFGIKSKDNNLRAPGLSWYKYIENGNSRTDYQYLTFLKSETDLNSAPGQEGPKFLQVFVALYPETRRIVQFGVLVGEGRPEQRQKLLLWSELIGWVENCEDN